MKYYNIKFDYGVNIFIRLEFTNLRKVVYPFSIRLLSLTIEQFLIIKFVFYCVVTEIVVTFLTDDVTNYTGKCFPFFLSFFLMIFEKVIVRLENWKLFDM